MIEKMIKTTVFFKKEERIFTLKMMRELGILHVDSDDVSYDTKKIIDKTENKLKNINILLNVLSDFHDKQSKPLYSEYYPGTLMEIAFKNYKNLLKLKEECSNLETKYKSLMPWESFSYDLISRFKQYGLFFYLCVGTKALITEYEKMGFISEIINKKNGMYYFVLISEDENLQVNNAHIQISYKQNDFLSIEHIYKNIIAIKNKIKAIEKKLCSINLSIDKLKNHKYFLEKRLEFCNNINKTNDEFNEISYINGFIPENSNTKLLEASKKYGWGVLNEIPDEQVDNPPIILNPPKILSFSKCLFQFVGMYPGYFEWDISTCFLLFFSIFCGIILGDAGYGLFFLAICIYIGIRSKNTTGINDSLKLFFVLSVITIIWGTITCSFFGIPEKFLPDFMKNTRNFIFGEDDMTINNRIEGMCFIFGGIHLSFARIWRAVSFKNLVSIGELGWALVIWANSFTLLKFIAKSDFFLLNYNSWMYMVGVPIILIFHINWKKTEDILNIVFGFIGSFSDVLSYIRLFAVWFAGIKIIECFSSMANIVAEISPSCVIFSSLIMIAAHLMNLGLASIAVLVHSMRLNMLEFSNQMGLRWTGVEYTPFKIDKK